MATVDSGSNMVSTMIDLQEIGATLLIHGEIEDPAYRHFNPSLAWQDGELKIAIRSCNFAVIPKGKYYFRDGSIYSKTDVIYGDLDPDTLQVSSLKKLEFSKDTPTRIKVSGLEDVRLFNRKDGMHAIGFESDRLTRSLHNASASMAEFIIKDDRLMYLRTLEKPVTETVEKNWSPTDTPSKLFDFTYSDSQVWKDGKLIGHPSTTQIHGGSQLLKQKTGYISIVHEKKHDAINRRYGLAYDRFVYYTYLAKHDDQGIITGLSKPFRFGTLENIEFASGLVEHDGNLLITLGIRDCKWAVCRIEKSKLMGLFE